MEELERAPSIEALLVRLAAERDRLVERAIEAFDTEHPALPALPAEERRRGFVEILPLGLAAVGEDRAPTEAELEAVRGLTRRRARQGLSLEATLHAYRSGATFVMEEATRAGDEIGLGAEDLLRLTRRFWSWLDSVTAEVADAYHEAEEAEGSGVRRAAALRGLLEGTIGATALHETARELGLDPDAAYAPCVARPTDGVPPHRARLALEGAGAGGAVRTDALPGLVAGVVVRRPADVPGLVVGVGPEAPLSGLAGAADQARVALDTATAFDLPAGTYDLGALGLLPVVLGDPGAGSRAVRCCFGPFPSPEPLASTLRALLDAGLHVDAAAQSLGVHANTLRYRVRRFEAATGLSLGRTEDVVLVWWALQRRRLDVAGEA